MADLEQQETMPTEHELLDQAFKDTPAPAPEPQPAPTEEAPVETKTEEQPRNERGQFAPKVAAKTEETPVEPPKTEAPPQPAKTTAEEDASIPSWRAREIADERRAAQAEAQQLRAELARMQARMAAEQPQAKPQEEIDPLLDPIGYRENERRIRAEERAQDRLNFNLALTHYKHGETFEKAYEALVIQGQNGNYQLVQHLARQANPGEAIVNWYQTGELVREVGPDPKAYRQKLSDELLKDPEHIKKALEIARATANGQSPQQSQPGQRPNTVVQLPPSLSRATGSSAQSDLIDADGSDRALFDSAFR